MSPREGRGHPWPERKRVLRLRVRSSCVKYKKVLPQFGNDTARQLIIDFPHLFSSNRSMKFEDKNSCGKTQKLDLNNLRRNRDTVLCNKVQTRKQTGTLSLLLYKAAMYLECSPFLEKERDSWRPIAPMCPFVAFFILPWLAGKCPFVTMHCISFLVN